MLRIELIQGDVANHLLLGTERLPCLASRLELARRTLSTPATTKQAQPLVKLIDPTVPGQWQTQRMRRFKRFTRLHSAST